MMVASRRAGRWEWREALERDLRSHVNRVGTDYMRAYGGGFWKSKVSLSKRNLFFFKVDSWGEESTENMCSIKIMKFLSYTS